MPALTTLVGQGVYGLVRPQAAPIPSVLITRTQTVRQNTYCRQSKLVSADLQIDAYAINGDSAWAVANALRAALVDFTGMMSDVSVNKVFLTNEFPLVDPDPGVMRVTQIYNIWYLED